MRPIIAAATIEHAKYIAEHMRQADAHEVWLSHGNTPKEAIVESFKLSDRPMTLIVDNRPVIMWGAVACKHDLLEIATVWMLGTDELQKARRYFLRHCKPIIAALARKHQYLFNYVHAKNTVSLAWLKHCGFTIDTANPCTMSGEKFFYIYIGAKNV